MAITETILVLAEEIQKKYYPEIELTSLPPFYNHPDYIRVLGNSIQEAIEGKIGNIYSFYHGVPERHIRKSDVTKSHCKMDEVLF